jgi:hypothetical protein
MNAHANHLAVSPDRRKLDEAVERERRARGFDRPAAYRNWRPIGAVGLAVVAALSASKASASAFDTGSDHHRYWKMQCQPKDGARMGFRGPCAIDQASMGGLMTILAPRHKRMDGSRSRPAGRTSAA